MLRLLDITKDYSSGDSAVHALKGVSVSFRDNEFVSILGHSGCGKTTLLNIIGGLDHYTSGDLIINGKSTKEYKDRDWDNYRNHSIGFVFQSYNLIPHQTVLGNVELALTLSGVKRAERRALAQAALLKVGLADQIHKRPNQLSGGQMQRVAIARALVNNPDIILADEPTGALDTETSVQVMELLKEVAKDKLVIMVTHNPELAEQYSTRLVRLKDGEIISDSMPYDGVSEDEISPSEEVTEAAALEEAPVEAVAEAFSAEITGQDGVNESAQQEGSFVLKKKEKKPNMSFLTAFSLSIRNLFTKKGRTFLTAFAGSIGIIGIALILSLSHGFRTYISQVESNTLSGYPIVIHESSSNVGMEDLMELFAPTESQTMDDYPTAHEVYSNPLASSLLKKIRDNAHKNDMKSFKTWLETEKKEEVAKLTNAVKYSYNTEYSIYSVSENSHGETRLTSHYPFSSDNFPAGFESFQGAMDSLSIWEELVSNQDYLDKQYDLLTGRWPKQYEASDNEVFDVVLSVDKYNRIYDYLLWAIGVMPIWDGIFNNTNATSTTYSFDDFIGREYKVVLAAEKYQKEGDKWTLQKDSTDYMKNVAKNAITIRIAGIIRPKDGVTVGSMGGVIGYTEDLTKHIVEKTFETQIVKEQIADPEINVLTGEAFADGESQEFTLETLGVADIDSPNGISFYVKSFAEKEKLIALIDEYNELVGQTDSSKVIKYTDTVAALMSSVNTIIDAISYVLIAFVSISLIVSSIMIGIITYISVLERTKEIGVLRSIGASKRDISRLFNAETLTIGLMSGLFGIVVTLILNIPINLIIAHFSGLKGLAILPLVGAVALVAISMFLSFIAGFIPSKIAAKKDPVVALRTE